MAFKLLILLLVVVSSLSAGYAQVVAPANHSTADSLAPILGQWSGTFDGASSGKLELMLQRDSSSNQLSGQLTVILSDGARYSTKLKKAAFTNSQFTASYTEPDDGSDVSLQGQLSGSVLKGDWTVNDGQGKGSWQAIHPLR